MSCLLRVAILIAILFGFPHPSSTSRILFLLPLSCRSEVNSIHPLAKELLFRGHHVTWITSLKSELSGSHENYTELVPIPPPDVEDYVGAASILRHRANYVHFIPHLLSWNLTRLAARCNAVYSDPTFQNVVFSPTANFDIVIINGNLHHCLIPIISVLHPSPPPFIAFTTIPFTGEEIRLTGWRQPASFVPSSNLPFTQDMPFGQRLFNFINRIVFTFVFTRYIEHGAESTSAPHLLNRTAGGGKLAPISSIQAEVAMMFSNSHPALSSPRPLTPDIVEVGCLHCREGVSVHPEELNNWMEESPQGVVLFSMGSMFSFPPKLTRLVMETFERLDPVRVLVVGSKMAGGNKVPKNVKVVKWISQQDVLAHKKLRLFVSHGGMQSYLEAAFHAVPVVFLPIYADQAFAAAHVRMIGNGVAVELLDVTAASLKDAIREVLSNPRYKAKANELSVIFKDQPESPLKRAVFWTEYVIRHKGAKHLRSAARKLNYLQYHDIDLVVFIFAMSVFPAWITTSLMTLCRRWKRPTWLKLYRALDIALNFGQQLRK
ncbi:UDP-glucuronosyltransferase 2C1-like [Folsomia candida]|uniref:UDP-glucuronosyltransferase 2C1-like n=1 Tax=Folsomia candida TaxID=158441 RepID=UPI0016055B3B|nr:UDP-glucuronosyltransferase 2C1-like [Folsomia candida]